MPEENFWTSWCKGRLTEADTPTIQLGATPSGLTSAHLHHPTCFLQAGCPSNSVKALKATKQFHENTIAAKKSTFFIFRLPFSRGPIPGHLPKFSRSNRREQMTPKFKTTCMPLFVIWIHSMFEKAKSWPCHTQLDSMCWFSHRRSPSPPGGYAMVSSVAACCVPPTFNNVRWVRGGHQHHTLCMLE